MITPEQIKNTCTAFKTEVDRAECYFGENSAYTRSLDEQYSHFKHDINQYAGINEQGQEEIFDPLFLRGVLARMSTNALRYKRINDTKETEERQEARRQAKARAQAVRIHPHLRHAFLQEQAANNNRPACV